MCKHISSVFDNAVAQYKQQHPGGSSQQQQQQLADVDMEGSDG